MIFRFWSRQYVAHLEAEIAWLRLEAQKARQEKADAVDAMVRVKTGGRAGVPLRPLIADREKEVTNQIEDLFANPEFARAGTE